MAATINCDLCGVEEAAFMLTSLTDGSTNAVGNSCAQAWLTGLAQTLGLVALPAELVPADMGGTLVLESAVAQDGAGPGKPVRGKRGGRKAAPEPIPVDEETDEETDEPTATTSAPVEVTG